MKRKIYSVFMTIVAIVAFICLCVCTTHESTNASNTYIDNSTVKYEVINVDGHKVAVFKYANDIEVVKL